MRTLSLAKVGHNSRIEKSQLLQPQPIDNPPINAQLFDQIVEGDMRTVHRITCVGGGSIGSGWAALFAAHGLDVTVYDPRPEAEQVLRRTVEAAREVFELQNHDAGPMLVSFTTSLDHSLDGADFVQESGPETLDAKQRLFAKLDHSLASDVLIASSTSNLPMTDIQSQCLNPERTLVAHPISPPYAVPLVELSGGVGTSQETLQSARLVYERAGRSVVILNKELFGFIANRLQVAVLREAMQMIIRDSVTIDQIDTVLMQGIGLRWASIGVFGAYITNMLDRDGLEGFFMRAEQINYWHDCARHEPMPVWDDEVKAKVRTQFDERMGAMSLKDLAAIRDLGVVELLKGRSLVEDRIHRNSEI